MKIHDAFFGFFFLALGALVLFAIRGYPNIPGQPVGPSLFPGLIAQSRANSLVCMGRLDRFAASCGSTLRSFGLRGVLYCGGKRTWLSAYWFFNVGCFVQSTSSQMGSRTLGRSDCYIGDSFCLLQTAARSPTLGHSHTLGLVSCSH